MKFSIIICTYNKLQHLKLTLQSYHTAFQTFPYFEVIVCNDGGEDLEADYLKNYYSFDLKYIKIMHSGRPKARNTGLEAAEGDIVLFNDDDILINPECLKYHMDCHLTNRDCIVLGENHMLDLQKELFNQREPVSIITKDRLMNTSVDAYDQCTKNIVFDQREKSNHWACGTSGNFSMPKDVLLQLGAFDENFSGWGYEDIELAYRLSQNGLFLFCNLSQPNYHVNHTKNNKEMLASIKKNIIYFYEKYHKSQDIKYYWDFLRGSLSFLQFDRVTFHELDSQGVRDSRYYGLILSRLPDIDRLKSSF